ncbi:Pheromone/general odorant binding protein [Cinara cedri]|uniref:Pheromone/general odorant binding protein n=1 Tax=Cinara cedri TaxID=506608 RepID=A0A5E4M2K1_9HEMI|nr:Pheromone/general odorant binding protein [Cinara cedri]
MENIRKANTAIAIIILMVLSVGQSYPRSHPGEIEDMKVALYSACSKKFPITEEMKANAKNGIFSEDRGFKCFVMCVFEEVSLIDDEGNIDESSLIAMADGDMKPLIEDAAKTCLPNIAGKPDSCEVAFNFVVCSMNINKKLIELLPV